MAGDALATLAALAGGRLKAAGLTLATAESCTGGWVSQVITAVAGSSDYFDRGWITYSNAAKVEQLGVRPATLERFGAVSEETAREMAQGALDRGGAGIALAVTGIAGPGGGTEAKPVGTVCFAWVLGDESARSETLRFSGERESVRRQAVTRALQGMIELLDAQGAQD